MSHLRLCEKEDRRPAEVLSGNFSAYGLTLRLPFQCPALPAMDCGAAPDVEVVEGDVPRRLPSPVVRNGIYDAEPGRYLFRGGSRSGRFLVEDGRRITLERNPDAEEPILAFHFLHSVMAALLHQRGLLVLHASAAVIGSGAAVLSGPSGAGKSTLPAALMARGCPMLSDDVTALRLRPDGELEALPGAAQIHLCDDAAVKLSPALPGLPRHSWHRMKVAVPARAIAAQPLSFRRWIALAILPEGTPGGEQLRVRQLSGASKLAALHDCILGPLFAEEHVERFPLASAVMERVPLLSVERPAGKWTVDQLVGILINEVLMNG